MYLQYLLTTAAATIILHTGTFRRRVYRSRIHERTISLRFLGIFLRVLRLEVSIHNVYITNQFQTTFAQRGRGEVKFVCIGDCELRPRIRPLVKHPMHIIDNKTYLSGI
jgi:hypothetical protein